MKAAARTPWFHWRKCLRRRTCPSVRSSNSARKSGGAASSNTSASRRSTSGSGFIFQFLENGFLQLPANAHEPRFDGLFRHSQLPGDFADGVRFKIFAFDQIAVLGWERGEILFQQKHESPVG